MLELKHLAGYLPYGLKGISTEENLGVELVKGFSIYGKNDAISLTTDIDDIAMIMFKPILRPLSDLTKEIEINGNKFVPIVGIMKIKNNGDWIGLQHKKIDENPFYVIQKLLEGHFDIYGLIEANLAIDINTLK